MSLLNPIDKSFCLEQICATNYQKLFRLIPGLNSVKDSTIGNAPHNTQLLLKVIERTPYTLTIELSHCFNKNPDERLLPAVIIRIYLDAQLAEVLSDHARDTVARVFDNPGLSKDIMDYKWRLNYFLQKWLEHCLQQHYQFCCKTSQTTLIA